VTNEQCPTINAKEECSQARNKPVASSRWAQVGTAEIDAQMEAKAMRSQGCKVYTSTWNVFRPKPSDSLELINNFYIEVKPIQNTLTSSGYLISNKSEI